jgi:peptidoglycan/xylan/chitin deacetylase (PgdA/CDA1 family)
MWRIGGIAGVLLILGVTAVGYVSAQKMAAVSSSPLVSRSPDPSTGRGMPAASPRTPVNPASERSQGAIYAGSSADPIRPAEPPKPAPAIADTPSPNVSAQNKLAAIPPCGKPDGMGLSRIVEIDTTGGPGFGLEHFKQYDFLHDKEIVLTFDDGPWPGSTPAVLKALTDECLKATFFEIGEHATWHPEITREVIGAGMTVGTHTWSHKDLARKPFTKDIARAEAEIEMGISAVQMAAGGGKVAPFFRFPYLLHPPQLLSYLGERNIATFSTDIDSRDFKLHKPEEVIKSVMTQLEKRGKGIILMHDFHRNTAEALPELIRQLKDGGYKIVRMVPKGELTTLPKYDDIIRQKYKLSSDNTRSESSVVRTIGD